MSVMRGRFCSDHDPYYETWMLPLWLGWIADIQIRWHNRRAHRPERSEAE